MNELSRALQDGLLEGSAAQPSAPQRAQLCAGTFKGSPDRGWGLPCPQGFTALSAGWEAEPEPEQRVPANKTVGERCP